MKERLMRFLTIFILVASAATAGAKTIENFDKMSKGDVKSPWIAGVTGNGEVKCEVVSDSSAPSQPHALKQSKEGSFPFCVKTDVAIENGFVEVRFKALAGKEDEAGGVIWRFKDGDNYYVARANALEDNVSLYYTEKGKRKTIKYTDAKVAKDEWHLLRVEFAGTRIKVILDGVAHISLDDEKIKGPGAVGVWTKADSVTLFDDFSYEETK
jgi:hypothetical protein